MKNKKLIMIVSLVAAFALLVGTAFAAQPANQGYEAFKDFMKNHKEVEYKNGTVTGTLKVTDNEKTLFEMTGAIKGTKDEKQVSGNISIIANQLNKSLELYGLAETMYIFNNEAGEYYQINNAHNRDFDEDFYMNDRKNHDMSSEGEALIDYLMGDLKDDFTQTINADGSSTIEFELTKDEIPAPLNLLVSAASKNHEKYEEIDEENYAEFAQYPLFNDLKNMKVEVPKLTDDVKLEYVKAAVEINKNQEVTGMSFILVQSGKDETGAFHEITAQGRFEISNLNETIVDVPDLESKNIQVLPEISRKGRPGRH